MKGIETLGVIIVSHDVYVVMQWIGGIIGVLMLVAWIFKCVDEDNKKASDLKNEEAHRKYKQLQNDLEMEELKRRVAQRKVNQDLADKNIKL